MSMQKAQRQMPAHAGREVEGFGESMPDALSDEAFCLRHATGSTGSALLQAALTTENLRRAFKRVRANKELLAWMVWTSTRPRAIWRPRDRAYKNNGWQRRISPVQYFG